MKKTALSLSLLLALVAGTMVGCNDVKSKKDGNKEVLFTVGEKNFTVDDLLGFDNETKLDYDFLQSDEGVQTVYETIYNAIAQKHVEITSTIDAAVKERMDDWDEEVKEYASANGVTERNAEKTKLEELGLEDTDALEKYFYVEEQKEELETLYNNSMMEPAVANDAATLTGKSMVERYVSETAPMITEHVLVKVASSDTLSKLAQVTKEEVDKITTVMQRLALGKQERNTFKNIAVEESEDGSASKGGVLGIMDSYTSFVNEYKLGLYVNELIENHTKENFDAKNTLGAKNYMDDLFGENGVYKNYEVQKVNIATVASVLAYVAEDEAKEEQEYFGHDKKAEYDADLYPRNVIYNMYFNFPGIQYLTVKQDAEEVTALVNKLYAHTTQSKVQEKINAILDSDYYKSFAEADKLAVNADGVVLTNIAAKGKTEENIPVVLAKSTYGLHFLATIWSSLDNTDQAATEFFMYNNKVASTTYAKDTRYEFGYSSVSVSQNARKTEIKDRVLNYVKGGFSGTVSTSDNLYNYDIYDYYLAQGEVEIENADLAKAVKDYIDNQRELKAAAITDAFEDSWESYIDAIKACQETHAEIYK